MLGQRNSFNFLCVPYHLNTIYMPSCGIWSKKHCRLEFQVRGNKQTFLLIQTGLAMEATSKTASNIGLLPEAKRPFCRGQTITGQTGQAKLQTVIGQTVAG